MKVNSQRCQKRDSTSVLYFTALWLASYDRSKQVKVLAESFLVEKPTSLQISCNMYTFDVTKLYQNNPQSKL